MESVLRRRILEALDEEQEIEQRQHDVERDKRHEEAAKEERQIQVRALNALETSAQSLRGIHEMLMSLHTSGAFQCNRR